MVLAIMIMGLAAAITVPRIGSALASAQIRSATTVVIADLEYLRRHAVVTGRDVNLQWDVANRTLQSADAMMPERPTTTFWRDLADQFNVTSLQVPAGQSSSLRFDRRGGIWADQTKLDSWQLTVAVGSSQATVTVTDVDITGDAL